MCFFLFISVRCLLFFSFSGLFSCSYFTWYYLHRVCIIFRICGCGVDILYSHCTVEYEHEDIEKNVRILFFFSLGLSLKDVNRRGNRMWWRKGWARGGGVQHRWGTSLRFTGERERGIKLLHQILYIILTKWNKKNHMVLPSGNIYGNSFCVIWHLLTHSRTHRHTCQSIGKRGKAALLLRINGVFILLTHHWIRYLNVSRVLFVMK